MSSEAEGLLRGARPFAGRMYAMTRACALSLTALGLALAAPAGGIDADRDLEPLRGLARFHSLRQRLRGAMGPA